MKITIRPNVRGFMYVDFKDTYNDDCSIQESSSADEPCIWLGRNEGTHHLGKCLARMHLNQEQVKALLPLLEYFVEHGRLPEPRKEEKK